MAKFSSVSKAPWRRLTSREQVQEAALLDQDGMTGWESETS